MTIVEFLKARLDEQEERWRADYAAEWAKARVYADIATKRRIVDLHQPPTVLVGPKLGCNTCTDVWDVDHCQTLRLLASVWADHPDYDPAWAPDA